MWKPYSLISVCLKSIYCTLIVMKGCNCHFTKWQQHPLSTTGAIYSPKMQDIAKLHGEKLNRLFLNLYNFYFFHSHAKPCSKHTIHWPNVGPALYLLGVSKYSFTSLSEHSWQYRVRRKPKSGLCPTLIKWLQGFFYVKEKERNSIDSWIRMYEAPSIFESTNLL